MILADDVKEGLSIYDVSGLISVSVTTLKSWEAFFNIDIERNAKNARRYTQDNINIFRIIKSLSSKGLSLNEIKPMLLQQSDGKSYHQPKVEVIQDEPQENQNYDLILKPFINQITEYKTELNDLRENYSNVIQESATLKERVKNKDEIITFLQERLNRLESKKWYQVWR